MRAYITTWFVDQSSPNFIRPIGDEMQLIKYFSDFRYVDPFLIYLRSNSTVVKNRAEFQTFVTSQILMGAPLVKLVSTWSPRLWATSAGKISWGYAHYPNVI